MRDLLLWLMDSLVVACGLQSMDLVAAWHVGPWFPRQGFNPRPLHYSADSEPLDHQGSPSKQSRAESNTGISYYFRDEETEG